ncbi:ATP-binding protein [Spirosoma sp. HMF4905]|uniref:ATP-binding protein n=1 Tax=Spirosoma arboris TaxID=2682092 RepID=A0A7K1SIU1_9BACT|nr:ATP-binding protein [Spirosoma arboris]MVM33648.1 ATP-binding protein [Spirosoma arboris]
MIIKFPKNFYNQSAVLSVLEQTKFLFGNEWKFKPGMRFDCREVHKISIYGVLILYKIIDYGYRNQCFFKASFLGNMRFFESVWKLYGFSQLMSSYFEDNHTDRSYSFMEFKTEHNIIIAPQPLLRMEHEHVNNILQRVFAPKLNAFYNDNPKGVDMAFGCISEIIGNFWEHSNDQSSMLVAEGLKDQIEISCVDNGFGIISTMRKSNQFKASVTDEAILLKALNKGITSKPKSNHMGYGLWIIDEIVTRVGGKFFIFTEGVYYSNEYKKKSVKKCGFWRGTILYLLLPMVNPITPSQIIEKELVTDNSTLPINFV